MTPSSGRVDDREDPVKMEQYLGGDEEFEFSESREKAVEIMRALAGGEPFKIDVNYPNEGQIPNLPDGTAVETSALLTGTSVTPLCAGSSLPFRGCECIGEVTFGSGQFEHTVKISRNVPERGTYGRATGTDTQILYRRRYRGTQAAITITRK